MVERLPLVRQPANDLSLQPGKISTEMAVVQLFYDENHKEKLNRLPEEFRDKAKSAGISCRIYKGKQHRCSSKS